MERGHRVRDQLTDTFDELYLKDLNKAADALDDWQVSVF